MFLFLSLNFDMMTWFCIETFSCFLNVLFNLNKKNRERSVYSLSLRSAIYIVCKVAELNPALTDDVAP